MHSQNQTGNLPGHVIKYLKKYAEPERYTVECEGGQFCLIIVVPVLREYENLPRLIDSLKNSASGIKALVIFVVNSTKVHSPEIKEDNRKSIELIRREIGLRGGGKNLFFGVIDASGEGKELPEKEGGVGLARKIGMDAALLFFDYYGSGNNILVCLDADCTVSGGYLEALAGLCGRKDFSAGYAEFEHPLPKEEESKKAIICYEIFLRYYLAGLKIAYSPYAVHTIGSTMVCTPESYIKAEGMNKRKAAEDFYFMEKLAKHYRVEKISGAVVYPSSRPSRRVPFGTGQRVKRFLDKVQNEYILYSPESFLILKEWNKVYYSNRIPREELPFMAENISEALKNFLQLNNFQKSMENIYGNCRTEEQLFSQKKQWFDAFKTLKLIHYLRDNGYPPADMFTAVDTLLEIAGEFPIRKSKEGAVPSIDIQLEYLITLKSFERKQFSF